MRIRLFILISTILPIFFLYGLDSYLGRYEQHSKYLSKLKESLVKISSDESIKISNVNRIISSIDAGNFLDAAACFRAGDAAEVSCRLDQSNIIYKAVANIDILKGGYKDRSGDYIEDFKKKFVTSGGGLKISPSFNHDFNFISDNDIDSWQRYKGVNHKRYSYYSRIYDDASYSPSWYINGGSVFEPAIFMSNVSPTNSERIRVLAISDSFGAGFGLLSIDDSWAKELESQLNQIEDKYEVIVLAQGGAGYNEYLKWVRAGYVEAIDPDIVLLSFFRNDFNLLHDFGNDNRVETQLGVDEEFVFYLRCFEKEDDFLGRVLKKLNKVMPHLYRYYKFRNCGESLSRLNSRGMINHNDVVKSYNEIDRLIKVPTFLYQIESSLQLDTSYSETLKAVNENGLNFIVDSNSKGLVNNNSCLNVYSINFKTCNEFKANVFDNHFNRVYSKSFIESNIDMIKKSIDKYTESAVTSRKREVIGNNSEAVIVDFLPNTLFVSNVDSENATVGFFKGESYGYGRSSENFCVPFDRKGVILNFNKYLTEGREVKISSEFQRGGLGLVPRGYDSEGRVVFGEAIELKPGSPVTFRGSESIRGVVVVSNNRDCGSKNTEIDDEFLLQVEVL
jgi:hypothetical protein